MIEVLTLGGASIRRDGRELDELTALKQKIALLVYLALEGPVPRDRLLGVFWSDRPDDRARHALSQALYVVKRELGAECISVVGDRVGIAPEAIRVDAREMQAAAEREEWDEVAELYQGPFLDRFYLTDCPEFEDWCSRTRTRLARLAQRAFAGRIEKATAAGDLGDALSTAWRWAALQPLEDEAQHALIALLARTGDRSAALRQYGAYRDRLARELDVEPLADTVDLVGRIRAGAVPEYRPLGAAASEAADQVREPAPTYVQAEPPSTDRAVEVETAGGRREHPWVEILRDLRDRRIFQVGLVYLGVAWLGIQITDTLIERGMLPEWTFPVLLFFLAMGLPLALVLAWVQESVADGRAGAAEEAPSGRWPRWFEQVRGGHVLLVLSALVFALLAGKIALDRIAESPPPIDAASSLEPTRIAVLYFDDHSPGQELGYLADGLTEALIQELNQVETLEVISRNGVKPYRDDPAPLDSVARALRTGSLVAGSVSRSGDSLRVTVELVDGATLTQLTSRTIDRTFGELFSLQSEITEQTARWLRERLGVEIRLRERKAATESVEAWQLVRRGEKRWEDYRSLARAGDDAADRSLTRTDSLLARAEALDDDWVEPIVLRGWVAADVGLPESLHRALDHAQRALNLAPRSATALELRGTVRHRLAWEASDSAAAARLLDGAERDLEAAVAADPRLASAWSTLAELLYRAKWQLQGARHAARRAYEEDAYLTDAYQIVIWLTEIALQLEDYDTALRWCTEGRRRFPESLWFVGLKLAILASPGGPKPAVGEAWRLVDEVDQLSEPGQRELYVPIARLQVAGVLTRAGLEDSARAVIDEVRAGADSDLLTYLAYDEAHVRLMLGERAAALRLLGRYLDSAPPEHRAVVARDSWFRPLWGHPRFEALVDRDRLPIFCRILCSGTTTDPPTA